MTPQEARMKANRHAAYKSTALWLSCATALVYAVKFITAGGVF